MHIEVADIYQVIYGNWKMKNQCTKNMTHNWQGNGIWRKPKYILMETNDILTGPVINSIVTDGDEPLPSLSDWHDYEPNLEFDDSELTHPPHTNGMYCNRTERKMRG